MRAVVHRPSGPDSSSEFEHSSIPATVKKIFNLKEFLTKRDAWAGTFETVLTRTTPRTDCPVTLPDVKKMRTTEAAEGAPLSDFQRELVQLAAVLNGDHANPSIFPDALVQGMTVAEGAKYTQDAFKAFLQEAQRCRNCGTDESYIVALQAGDEEEGEKKKKKPSWYKKWLTCLICNQKS